MKFSKVIAPETQQEEQFAMMQDLIYQFLNGTNCTIFAYGQTGAGKTFSMIGECQEEGELIADIEGERRGILPRSLELILAETRPASHKDEELLLSFFEIYNDKVYDLFSLEDYPQPLDVRESKAGEITIPDMQEFKVQALESAIELLHAGLHNRVTGSTAGNKQSSRSHSIFQIKYRKRGKGKPEFTESLLRIVDLAGSEKYKIPSSISQQEKEVRIQ
jgi:hypothetical protein